MGKSGSSSQANQSAQTTNEDNRIVNDSGIVAKNSALSFSSATDDHSFFAPNSGNTTTANSNNDDHSSLWLANTTNNTTTANSNNDDHSSLWLANTTNNTTNNTSVDSKVTGQAFDFATKANAVNGDGFTKLLTTAAELVKGTQDSATTMAARFQDNVAQAFDTGRNTTPGGLDNKSMVILGVSAAAALAVYSMNKGR